ncbi:hypothetical protein [Bailinhaonella thermotolerans]|uniref:Uncharacterized protein n=1 Tax=Bailinhaonella thermotolerans TaxID=1070861 RepID=A0A3A4AQB6_9ACTN|nr:hypothetical protein [Bailinhaonella thermotolerans]RJL31896.1 hypothetical protein D5H75_15670 [Bailinhaonella thermotolerans]
MNTHPITAPALGLTLVLAALLTGQQQARAAGIGTEMIREGRVIGSAHTTSPRTTLDVCDHIKGDAYRVRTHWTNSIGMRGTLEPRDGRCASKDMWFGITFKTVQLCEVYLGKQRDCQNARRR